MSTAVANDERRTKAFADFRKRLLEHREVEAKLKECMQYIVFLSLFIFPINHKSYHADQENCEPNFTFYVQF
jgi:hypothetical protein